MDNEWWDERGSPSKEDVRDAIEIAPDDLPDGAYWMWIHDYLGVEYGVVFDYIAEDPEFYDYELADSTNDHD